MISAATNKFRIKLQYGLLLMLSILAFDQPTKAQVIEIGSGSYTTQFPGTDVAGRNGFPSGSPLTIGAAANKPAPTNDWWSKKIKENHADNLFSYPYTLKTVNQGLVVSYIPWGVIDAASPIVVGVTGLNASVANVSDFSDWTVSMDWSNGGHNFQATAGIGMPFLYFNKASADLASITVNEGSVSVQGEMLVITDAHQGADFAIYAPTGSEWQQSGNTYTSSLNGQNYWSMAFLPFDAATVLSVAEEYKNYAYVFPTNTTTSWNYDETNAVMRTEFFVETEIKEGIESELLLGLLPHQWAHLAGDSPSPQGYSYPSVRGELKTLASNSFAVENTFHGILPTLPYLDFYSEGFNPQSLTEKIELVENNGLDSWTDSYNDGQLMNRLIQTGRVANLMGDFEARDKIVNTVKERLEDWLTVESGEVAFLFYYHEAWTALLGYPGGHGQDTNINDHHFHWGYFIHAASFIEQFEPGWANEWGEIINYLVRDAASSDRNDPLFPFLRNFSPYAGHCWANGFATFPQGNDQESTSESMQFNSALIHWGAITGDDAIRDLGIYLYTTEQTATEEYWFDQNERVFGPNQQYKLVSRVWGNSYDNGTFWTSDIAASYGIELYPIHGGSLYLGQNLSYAESLWAEIEQNTGILNNEVNPNLWHDVMWEYLAFTDPAKAIELYDSNPDRSLKFGISDAQTYHWLHSMNALGRVDISITADSPLAAVFSSDEETVYVGHNYGSESLEINFSDGYVLTVPAHSMATSKDLLVAATLSASFSTAYANGSVELQLAVTSGNPTLIEWIDGDVLIGSSTEAPFIFTAENLTIGQHSFYARIYEDQSFGVSNTVSVTVGEQIPFLGSPALIPGSFEAGHFDAFEGGIGQGISYNDINAQNNGDYRENEYVDAGLDNTEGANVGWIASGEWLEYTVDVEQAGNYTLDFRYACGNQNGGGPFSIESDGQLIKSGITVNYSGEWDNWETKTVANVPLKSGLQVLRLAFNNGELNLAEFSFSYDSPLSYDQPIANAGGNLLVQLPTNSVELDGTNSSDPENAELSYQWSQVNGPSVLDFSDDQSPNPTVTTLQNGVYLIKLTVTNGSYSDDDLMYVISSESSDMAPSASIFSPSDNSSFLEGEEILLVANASDLIGSIASVEFFVDGISIGLDTSFPYELEWTSTLGEHQITIVATNNLGITSEPLPHTIQVTTAPSCFGLSGNGEFNYEFSGANNNPTLTFLPTLPGMGSPTCILYYGTDAGLLPGYNVSPNVPFQLNAAAGETIYFYYTYSYPGQGEHNNSTEKDSYLVGTCAPVGISNSPNLLNTKLFPNPVHDFLNIELDSNKNSIGVFDITGKQVIQEETTGNSFQLNMKNLATGIYFIKINSPSGDTILRVVRE